MRMEPPSSGLRPRTPTASSVVGAFALLVALACTTAQPPGSGGGASIAPPEPTPAPAADAARAGVDVASLTRSIAEREYHARENSEGLQAPNRRHGLRSYFDASGVRVHDRREDAEPLVSLRLSTLERGERRPIGPGELHSEGPRVEIRRPGLVEWFHNSPAGLEQGITLESPPPGKGDVRLEIAVEGGRARMQDRDVEIETAPGRRLRYGKLEVVDARGRELEAALEVPRPDAIRIVLSDASAVYPVTIDPLLTSTSDTQLESDLMNAQLGTSVAGAGDVNGDGYADVIVGAPFYDAGEASEGAAFVFLGSAAGIVDADPATAHAQLESDQAGARLGTSVAGAGDVNGDGYADVIVGAPLYNAGEAGEGVAFVFLGSAAGIADGDPTTAHAQLESDQGSAQLGTSVAGAGDVDGDGYADVIVGAPSYAAGQLGEGAAFVFLGSAAGIADGDPATAHAQLEANQFGALMGNSVAGAGDVNADGYADVIVGARSYDAGETDEGAAFVFLGSAAGVADGNPTTAHAQLEADEAGAQMGRSVAAAGDVNGDGYGDVIVGAPFFDAGQADEGAAFVFHGSAAGVTGTDPTTADAQLESNQSDAWMGQSVAGVGDVNGDGYADVIVGAGFYDAGENAEGAAFVFLGDANGIAGSTPSGAAAQLESDQANARMGISVAGAGDVNGDGFADVIVGASLFDAGESDEGAAFVFEGGRLGSELPILSQAAIWEGVSGTAGLGSSVAGAGDVNGDGFADVIASVFDTGVAYVFHGGAAGLPSGEVFVGVEPDLILVPVGGISQVAGAGDVNGDGYADVIVALKDTAGALVYHGGPYGLADDPGGVVAAPETSLVSEQVGVGIASVSGAGDVNGDGYADVIVGAPFYDTGGAGEGAAFVFLGSAAGITGGSLATAHAQLESDQVGAKMGVDVAGVGDVNGDGYADVIVGAPLYDAGEVDEGAAFLFLGGPSGISDGDPTTAHAQLESDQADAWMGSGVAGAGDVNGDGHADVIVGAPFYDAGEVDEGAAFVFLGSASGVSDGNPATSDTQLESNLSGLSFGGGVAGAGDVNADGYADVVVNGAVWFGSATGIPDGDPTTAQEFLVNSGVADASTVDGAGDIDGDGYADLIGGIALVLPEFNGYIFVSSGLDRPVLAQQERAAPGAIIAPWGLSDHPNGFFSALDASSPSGRARLKLEVEACPAGRPFGHPDCSSSISPTWTDTGVTGSVRLRENVAGLVNGALYEWRARVLHAPFSVTEPGIVPPPIPAHGPWRRLNGADAPGDVRVGTDTDGDGLHDALELALGTDPALSDTDGDGLSDGDEVQVHGTDALLGDTDGDGLSDGDEILLHGTDPFVDADFDGDGLSDADEVATGRHPGLSDTDSDGITDDVDNCPSAYNPLQSDVGGGALTPNTPDGVGDLCQNADFNGDGKVDLLDVTLLRRWIVGLEPGLDPSLPPSP